MGRKSKQTDSTETSNETSEVKVRKTRTPAVLEPEMQALVDEAKAQQSSARAKIGQIKRLNKLATLIKSLDDDGQDQIIKLIGDKRNVVYIQESKPAF